MNIIDNDVKFSALQPITAGMHGIKYPYRLTLLAGAAALGLALGFMPDLLQDASAAPQSSGLPFALSASQTGAIRSDSMATAMLQSAEHWISVEIKPGDKLANVFKQLGLDTRQLDKVMALGGEAAKLARLYPGKTLKIKMGTEGRLQELLYNITPTRTLHIMGSNITGTPASFLANTVEHPLERRIASVAATIDSSLYLAGQKAGLPDTLTMELANIFGWDIDFAADVQRGDNFTVLYEEFYAQGEKVREGDILAAEFTNGDQTLRAIRFNDGKGHANYYTPDGMGMRKAFLRTPVEFSRISSGFSLGRMHPILNHIRSHKGVDYAAPTGTPVKAAGDGTVSFAGNKSGYGKTVILQHGQEYSTLYAHLSRYPEGLNEGSHVEQGQIIGYVGQSGLATGPHLHYEFRVNDQHRNPLTVKLTQAEPIPSQEKSEFTRQAKELLDQLASFKRTLTASTP